ncbi:MAG: PilZ domain-containing protein [Candidatus Thiodiazotropha sp.]|nr:PilZ domain-containing protein [Candidatus Thiodiazotropha sp.]MCM8883844.1 PilZ domain-containing protein [Candidatus Thiodiazotropha sp.]MCM8919831.1 PilZ domain-containing protein [Candidatus Thiodiazotropha sp.]
MNKNKLKSTASDDFLRRVERQRLESECLRPLDLRPIVTGPCKRFSYRGRSLWLDPDAHALFLEGLKHNAGVFTVETYESILMRLNTEAADREIETASMNSKATPPLIDSPRVTHNLAIDLSYFEKRVFDRFRISLNMHLLWNGKKFPAETRDISKSGLQLRLKSPIEVRECDQVRVDVMPSTDHQLEQTELDYRVVRIRRLLNDTLLALQCVENEPKDGLMVISEHIASSSESALSEQADPEDALLTAQALLAERFYMRSTTILPFFMFEDQDTNSQLRIIFSNQVNRYALKAFETSQGQYDFSSLVTLKRIKLLMRLAVRDSKADTLIAVYRSPGHNTPQVRADLECKNHKHWCRLLLKYADKPGFRVFKVVARIARRPVEMRIEDAVGPLAEQGNDIVRKLLLDAKTLSIVGALIDVTEQVCGWRQGSCSPEQSSYDDPIICCDDQQLLSPPQLVPIRYIQENRSEARFLGRMRVEIHVANRIYQGETRDVSAHGLSVMIAEPNTIIDNHRQATITFPKLEARSSGLARIQSIFRNVPAEIVSGSVDGEPHLRFKISDLPKGRQFSNAFSSYLEKRQSGLRVETSHTLRAATSRLYSSIFVESSSTLPVFVYRRSPEDWTFKLGITASPTPLTDFFEVADGVFDFDVFTSNGRLDRLMRKVTEFGSGEFTLYLYKERCTDSPSFTLNSMADFEIPDEVARRAYIRQALEHDFRCVKIVASLPNVPPKAEIEQAIDRLIRLSPGRSERLKADFENLIAIGDVVDMTGLVEEIWTEEPVANVV